MKSRSCWERLNAFSRASARVMVCKGPKLSSWLLPSLLVLEHPSPADVALIAGRALQIEIFAVGDEDWRLGLWRFCTCDLPRIQLADNLCQCPSPRLYHSRARIVLHYCGRLQTCSDRARNPKGWMILDLKTYSAE